MSKEETMSKIKELENDGFIVYVEDGIIYVSTTATKGSTPDDDFEDNFDWTVL